MTLSGALRAAGRTFVARPVQLLPFFVAGLAAPVAGQAALLLGIAATVLWLSTTGQLDAFLASLETAVPAGEPINVDRPTAVGMEPNALDPAFQELYTLEVAVLLGATLLAFLLAFALVSALATAGQVHAVLAVLRDRSGTRAGVDGVFRHWQTFLALAVAEVALNAVVLGGTALLLAALAESSPVAAVLVGLVAAPVALVVVLVARLLFAFAGPAAVVDDIGTIDALRGAYGYVAAQPAQAVGYGVFAIAVLVAVGTVTGVLTVVGSATAGSILSLLVVAPVLTLVKVTLLANHRSLPLAIPPAPAESYATRLRRAARVGVRELASFVDGYPLHVLASTAVLVAGLGLGFRIGGQVDHLFAASIRARLSLVNPVGSFFEYAANNWQVVTAQSFGGFALGVPTLAGLLFNGVNVGLLYALETEPQVLLAFVLPHGLLEIPAILFGGALGLHLGGVALGYGEGRVDRARLAAEVDRAFRVAIGLAVLVLVAALIEAVISPYYWRLLGL